MYWSLDIAVTDGGQRWIDTIDYIDAIEWWSGLPIDASQLPRPYTARLKKMKKNSPDHGVFMPPYFNDKPPIMSSALIAALEAEGVANLEHFPIEMHDPMNGQVRNDYRAVNILGVVYAANLATSSYTTSPGGARVDVAFDELVLHEGHTSRELMFRLGESVDVILVHDRLKRALERRGFTGIAYYKPNEIAT